MAEDLFKKTITRWFGPDGRRCPPKTFGATKKTQQSRKWYGVVNGEPTPLSADKAVASKMLRQLRAKADLASVGLADPYAQHKDRPLSGHLEDFESHLRAKGNTEQHIRDTTNRIKALLAGIKAERLDDLDSGRAATWLQELRTDREPTLVPDGEKFTPREVANLFGWTLPSLRQAIRRAGLDAGKGAGRKRRIPRATVETLTGLASRGVSLETSNHYTRAIRSFGRWLALERRVPTNPFDRLPLLNSQVDVRHARRELTAGELARLLAATRASDRIFRGLDGVARYHLYALACGSGLRAGALASLTPDCFDLASDRPTVTVSVRRDKSRKGKVQPLPSDVAALMREYLKGKHSHRPIWGGAMAETRGRHAAD